MQVKDEDFIYFGVKRTFDIFISIIFFIFAWPLLLIIAILIWKNDKANPFYTHTRVGQNKIPFKIYKYRSMVVNADEILFNNKELYKQIRSGTNKIKDDPRITKIGRFIRKTSIDEFPQFLNVLKGDMSFVGPRALRPDEYELYEKKSKTNKEKLEMISTVKPGITGYWQVSGRSKINFDKRMDMEAYYAKNKSLIMDIVIILKTPIAVLKGEGAE